MPLHLADSVQYVSGQLTERFGVEAEFELADYRVETELGYWGEDDLWVGGPFVILTGWMTISGERVAEVHAHKSVDQYLKPVVAAYVVTPRRWRKAKRTEVHNLTELQTACGA